MSSHPELKLAWCEGRAARYACERWHYSRTYPTGKPNHIGVWEAGRFVGTVIFGSGAAAGLGKPYELSHFEVAELVRVALAEHQTPVTRILAIAIRMVRKHNPGLRLLVSFADPFQGHVGAIYQAGGWIYSGTSQSSQMWRLPDGSMAHPRRFTGKGWNAPKPVPSGSHLIKVPGKHRYLFPLDNEMRKQIAPLAQPYPKKPASEVTPATRPAFQPGEGGAAPTRTLVEVG